VVLIAQPFVRGALTQITWADTNIRKPKDLIDKNVCVWLGGNELSMRALFGEKKKQTQELTRPVWC